MMSSNQPLPRLYSDLGRFSFPSHANAVKAFELSGDRNVWAGRNVYGGNWASVMSAYFASLQAACTHAERLRVQGTRFTIKEVAAAPLKTATGDLLLVHPTWGRDSRKVKLDFASKGSLSDLLSPLQRFGLVPYALPDQEVHLLPLMTSRLWSWSPSVVNANEYLVWDKETSRSRGHLIQRLCAVVTAIGQEGI